MFRKISYGIAATLALLVAIALSGCSGGNSGVDNAVAQPLVAQTYSEGCAFCHQAGSIVDVAVAHANTIIGPQGQITGVTIDPVTGFVTINFKLFESENNLVPLAGVPAANVRFSIAKLVPGTGGNASAWQSYINRVETKAAGIPGNTPSGTPTPDGSTAIQANTETATTTGNRFTDNGNGTYSYRLSFNITNVTTPLAVPYDGTLTHRVAMQVTGNATNAFLDFVPATGLPPTFNRRIVVNSSCNECHIRLGLHGGGRSNVEYCVTCHNPGTSDANSGNTVDFKVLIHKIHYAANLPSIKQLGWEYAIWGFGNTKIDFSTVVFPSGCALSRPCGQQLHQVSRGRGCT